MTTNKKYFLMILSMILLCNNSCMPVSNGKHAAKDGHKYIVVYVGINYSHGPKRFELKYKCEGKCDDAELLHNSQDLLEIVRNNIDKNKYKQFGVGASRAPHSRGRPDSEIVYQKQADGSWIVISKKINYS